MRVRILTLALAVLGALAACKRSTESKLLSTWNINVEGVTRMTFKPDHTCDIWSHEGIGDVTTDTVKWRVEGDQIVTLYKGKQSKTTIVKLTRDELQTKADGEQMVNTYTRIK